MHANASLSLKARKRMVARVVEHGWTITKAAEVSVQTALRRLRMTGPEIAEVLGRPLSTISGI